MPLNSRHYVRKLANLTQILKLTNKKTKFWVARKTLSKTPMTSQGVEAVYRRAWTKLQSRSLEAGDLKPPGDKYQISVRLFRTRIRALLKNNRAEMRTNSTKSSILAIILIKKWKVLIKIYSNIRNWWKRNRNLTSVTRYFMEASQQTFSQILISLRS